MAMMLFMRQRMIQTMCPSLPYRIRTISSNVCASGILILHAIPRTAKNTIMGEQLWVRMSISTDLRAFRGRVSPRCEPEWPGDTKVVAHERAAKHRSAPEPGRYHR